MKNSIFFLIKLCIGLLSTSVFAQTQNIDVKFTHSIYLEQRAAILKGLGKQAQTVNISWYSPSYKHKDVQALMIKTLPLSNYLSQKTGYLTLIENNNNPMVATKNIDFTWTNILGAQSLIKQGWIPLLKEDIEDYPVLVGSNTQIVKSFSDLKRKRIFASSDINNQYFMMYSLVRDGVLSQGEDFSYFQSVKMSEQELPEFIAKRRADFIVMNKFDAEKLVIKHPEYRIIYLAKKSIGNIFLASPKMNLQKMNIFKSAVQGVNDIDDVNILNNFDYQKGIKPIYDTDVILINDIFSLLGNYKIF